MPATDSLHLCPDHGVCDHPAACERHAQCGLAARPLDGFVVAAVAVGAVRYEWSATDERLTVAGVDRVLDIIHEAGAALDAGRRDHAAVALLRATEQAESLAGAICRTLPGEQWRAIQQHAGRVRRWRVS